MPQLPQQVGFFPCTFGVPNFLPIEGKIRRQDQVPFGGYMVRRGMAAPKKALPLLRGVVDEVNRIHPRP
jgi:hypothetical protein